MRPETAEGNRGSPTRLSEFTCSPHAASHTARACVVGGRQLDWGLAPQHRSHRTVSCDHLLPVCSADPVRPSPTHCPSPRHSYAPPLLPQTPPLPSPTRRWCWWATVTAPQPPCPNPNSWPSGTRARARSPGRGGRCCGASSQMSRQWVGAVFTHWAGQHTSRASSLEQWDSGERGVGIDWGVGAGVQVVWPGVASSTCAIAAPACVGARPVWWLTSDVYSAWGCVLV